MSMNGHPICCEEKNGMAPFLIATAIVFSVIIVFFFSYVGYQRSYSVAANKISELIEREARIQADSLIKNQLKDLANGIAQAKTDTMIANIKDAVISE